MGLLLASGQIAAGEAVVREAHQFILTEVQSLGDGMPIGVEIAAEIGRIVRVDRGFEALFQHSAQGVLGEVMDHA